MRAAYCNCGRHYLQPGEVVPATDELGMHSRERCTFDGLKPRYPTLLELAARDPQPAIDRLVAMLTERAPPQPRKVIRVEAGSDTLVHIEKLYGPWVVSDVRVWLDYNPGQWVVERLDDPTFDKWVEMARFDALGECCEHRFYADGKGGTLPCEHCGRTAPQRDSSP